MIQTSAAGAKGWVAAALAGVVAGVVAAHAFESSASPGTATTLQIVDRSHKGDRLDRGLSPASDAYTSDAHASGRMALRHLFERTRSLELHEACEPPASPIVDPLLAKLPGRCLT